MLKIGPGAEQRAPMATVIIWGMIISTVFTLYVIPCVYSLLSRFESKKHSSAHAEAIAALESIEQ
jgi:HAE1 family hydrophobic/amphiphilic exporter-1